MKMDYHNNRRVNRLAPLLVILAFLVALVPHAQGASLKAVLSKKVNGKAITLTVRDLVSGKIEIIKGQAGRDNLTVFKDPAQAELPTQPIERVRVGEWVPTRNPKTGKTEYKQVRRTFARLAPAIVSLRLSDARSGREVQRLEGTPEHPFFTIDRGMVEMGRLQVGEKVISRIGPALVVASVHREKRLGGYKVYNFEVADDHTYFVGKINGGVWVHNNCATIAAKAAEKFGIFDCEPCAKALVKAFQSQKVTGEVIELEGGIGDRQFIFSKSLNYQAIATNGRHIGVKVGDIVYDNIHKAGIPYDEWIKDLEAFGGIRVKTRTPF